MKRIAVLLCALMALQPLFALAAGEKNKDNLPIGDLAGFDGGWTWFGEDFHYDITNEEACWELLQRPVTVLDAEENSPVYPLDAPDGNRVVNQWQGGFINGSQAAVHVLGEDEDGWTLIEGLDYYDRVIRGYVKTSLLKTVTPNEKYGIIIDKLTQRLYMFIDGKLWSDCAVSTGLVDLRLNQPYNETASGEYLIGNWVGGFDSEGMYCAMGIRFNGGDLLHEVPGVPMADGSYSFTKFGSQLGRKASHGCVRVQRTPNDDGLCISWLWENLKRNTKVVIWDDDGRTIPYPDDSTQLYYNPNGGTSYHASATCRSVRDKYLPLTGFAYAELDSTYAKLDPCPHCVPAQRKSIIDERNEQWFELAEALNHPMVTGETVAEGVSVVVGEDDESAYGEVSIIIK
ncbi:MAG: L,D-transpeptidase [Clostridia bacterium]|nr:L,D-transpeptidase [Clostridia bacterium]